MLKKYYLLGKNIQKSLSPAFHKQLFKYKQKGNSFQYEIYPQQKKIPSVTQIIQDKSMTGFSITIPYKKQYVGCEQVKLFGIAKQINVINTLVKHQGNLKGYNTDYFGIKKALQQKISKYEKNTFLIVGCGATASTFCHFLVSKKVHFVLLNRGQQGIKFLKNKYGNSIVDTVRIGQASSIRCQPYKVVHKITGIINTLPFEALKQHRQAIQKLITSFNITQKQLTYMDSSYRKQICQQNEKLLLSNLNSSNIVRASGLQMLIWQAIQQNRLFLDQQVYSEDQYQRQAYILRQLVR